MNEITKKGFAVLQVAFVLGVLGNVLLRSVPWGLNVLVFNVAFVAAMIWLLRRYKPEFLTRQSYALFGAQIFFASMFVWRDSIELRIADSVAILAILSALFLPKMDLKTQFAGVFHYIVGFVWSGFNAVFSPFALVFSDIEWADSKNAGWSKHAFSVLRGVAIAAPLVLIFGGLFTAADAVYQGWIERVFNVMPETVFTHILLTSVFAWLSAGYLRGIIIASGVPTGFDQAAPSIITPIAEPETGESKVDRVRAESGEHAVTLPDDKFVAEYINLSDPPNKVESNVEPVAEKQPFEWAKLENSILPTSFTLGTVEVGVILGATNLLFLSFVIAQVPYLFGGMELVQNTPDFKLADYARRGFGELVAVSALVLPMLLIGHWLLKKDRPAVGMLFKVLAGIQITLLFVIMASAVQRLVLLTGNLGYGLTTVRLYPMIFMIWLAAVFVWFSVTVLRGARQHFAWGALWSAFFILGATHVLNPDEFIVKTNLALMREGRPFDADYNANLSDDSVSVLVNGLSEMGFEDQDRTILLIARRYCDKRDEQDLRSWNVSRSNSWNVMNQNTAFIETLGGCEGQLIKARQRYDDD